MKTELTHIDQIRSAFEKMQSKQDLLQLLNEAKPMVYGDKSVPFSMKQITWYANPKLGMKRYTEFKIRKKSGADRTINAPVNGLKSLQKTLSFVLQCVFEPHQAAMGFVRGKSIVDNARLHAGSRYVYNIDLKDFFPSIDQARLWKCLQLKPFNLTDDLSGNLQHTDNPTPVFIPVNLPYIKQTEKVLKFITLSNHGIPKGYHTLGLENGKNLCYIVESSTEIAILKGSSDLEYIWQLSEKIKKEKKLESESEYLVGIIIQVLIKKDRKNKKKEGKIVIANIIASLCCTEMEVERKNEAGEWEKVKRNVLPQGAPTSPVISNIVCQRMDYKLSGVAKRFGLNYSRYADDITFSSMHNAYQPESDFLKELHRIVAEQGFHIKESKTRLQKDGYRKEVTGLLVNENVNVQKRYIKQLRMWLYYWEAYGYERANRVFLQQYLTDKANVVKGKPDMVNVISGKLDYLKMVKGEGNDLYLKLKGRFDNLNGRNDVLDSILNIWEKEGIVPAMKFYYQNQNIL